MKEILSKVDEAQAKINALRPFSNEMNHQIKEYFRIGLTYSSNALEGNSLVFDHLQLLSPAIIADLRCCISSLNRSTTRINGIFK